MGVQPLQKTIHFKFKSQDSYESSQVNYQDGISHLQFEQNFQKTKTKNFRRTQPNQNLIFHFREKDQFQSASSINLPHPLVTSSFGAIGGNTLGTSSLHSQPSFEHATYSK